MISTDLLAKINCSFSEQDQRIILRSLLGNKLLSDALKEKEVHSFLLDDNPSLQKLMPANIGIFLIDPNKKLSFGDNSKQINTNLEEFSAEGSERLQQISGGNNFSPDLKDAFLISTSIYQGYLKQPTGPDFFVLFKNHRILNDEIDLWGLIFACLVYFNNEFWNLIQKAMRINPYPEFIKAIINCFYVNLMNDEKIEEVSIQLLNNQSIPVSTCYLELLRKQGQNQSMTWAK